jgi:hypothetical protein
MKTALPKKFNPKKFLGTLATLYLSVLRDAKKKMRFQLLEP